MSKIWPLSTAAGLEICNSSIDLPDLSQNSISAIDEKLRTYYESLPASYFDQRAQELSRSGYTKVTDILSPELMRDLSAEVTNIMAEKARRIDIKIDVTGNSPRKMQTINFEAITELGEIAPALYYSSEMRDFLMRVTRHHVYDCPYSSERLTGTRQTRVGDTHGWHWGDHQYALIFIVKAPGIESGGMLQCVPHTSWNKQDSRIHEILTECPIDTYHHGTGDIYFFKTDTTLHRTYPLEEDCERIILNFTFSGPDDLLKSNTHETMAAIFDFE